MQIRHFKKWSRSSNKYRPTNIRKKVRVQFSMVPHNLQSTRAKSEIIDKQLVAVRRNLFQYIPICLAPWNQDLMEVAWFSSGNQDSTDQVVWPRLMLQHEWSKWIIQEKGWFIFVLPEFNRQRIAIKIVFAFWKYFLCVKRVIQSEG